MKIRMIAVLLAVSVLVCSGCSQKGKGANAERGGMPQGTAQARQTVATVSDVVKLNATKTVTGTVQSIVGNEVTLLITSGGGQQRAERPKREIAEGEKAADMPQRAEFADGEMRQRGAETENGMMAEDKKAERSKEQTATYLLPVGMSMGSKDYSSITAGNTLKIYFGSHPDDGSEIITGVEVMGGRR